MNSKSFISKRSSQGQIIKVEEVSTPLSFPHSYNSLQASGGKSASSTSGPSNQDQVLKCEDSVSPLGLHTGSNLQKLGGKSSSSSSSSQVQVVKQEEPTSPLNSQRIGSNLHTSGGESSTPLAPAHQSHNLVSKVFVSNEEIQGRANNIHAMHDNSLSKVVMPLLEYPLGTNDLHSLQGENSTSVARILNETSVTQLVYSPEELLWMDIVFRQFELTLPTKALDFPSKSLPDTGYKVPRGESSTSVPTQYYQLHPSVASASLSKPSSKGIGLHALGNETSRSISNPQSQFQSNGTLPYPADLSYNGNLVPGLGDRSSIVIRCHQARLSALAAVPPPPEIIPSAVPILPSFDSISRTFTTCRDQYLPAEVLIPPAPLLYSGNDFQRLVRAVEGWPSATVLVIRPREVYSTSTSSGIATPIATPVNPHLYFSSPMCFIFFMTSPISSSNFISTNIWVHLLDSQATGHTIKFGVVIPSPWTFSDSLSSQPINRSPIGCFFASIFRMTTVNILKYPISPYCAPSWYPDIVYVGAELSRMAFGTTAPLGQGVTLELDGSLLTGVFKHRVRGRDSGVFLPKKWEGEYEENFVMADFQIYGILPTG